MNRLLVIFLALVGLVSTTWAGAKPGYYANGTKIAYQRNPNGELEWRWGQVTYFFGDEIVIWSYWGPCEEDPDEPGTARRAPALDHPVLTFPKGTPYRSQRIVRPGTLSEKKLTSRGSKWVSVDKAEGRTKPGGGSTINMGIDEDGGTLPRQRPWI